MEPRLTVIFLIFNGERYVRGLVEAITAQRHPSGRPQHEWLEVWFIDHGSRDGTLKALQENLAAIGSPQHLRIVAMPENIGISRALNQAFQLVKTPYALTCHCDVLFGRDDYVAQMFELMEKHPKAAVITGQPSVRAVGGKAIPFAEKVNLSANLMDIFRAHPAEALVQVGFAEGRCDIFRVEALRGVGLYDTTLKFAGEDQILAARLRQAGYELWQAPFLPYSLSVSSDQDSLGKLVHHTRVFGRAHPYILLVNRDTVTGIATPRAGSNRRSRAMLRLNHLFSVFSYLLVAVLLALGAWPRFGMAVFGVVLLAKYSLFAKHLRAVGMGPLQKLGFYLFQPVLDLSYTVGFVQGLWLVLTGATARKTIS